MKLRWKFGATDAEKYELPDWQTFDDAELDDLPSSKLEALEASMDWAIDHALVIAERRGTRGKRAVMWLTLRLAGSDVEWADFDPKTRRAVFAATEDDALPPDSAPESSSTDAG